MVDLAEAQLQGVARDVKEMIGSVGEGDMQLTTLASGERSDRSSRISCTAIAQFCAESTSVISPPSTRVIATLSSG